MALNFEFEKNFNFVVLNSFYFSKDLDQSFVEIISVLILDHIRADGPNQAAFFG